jgi:hypothetical protein
MTTALSPRERTLAHLLNLRPVIALVTIGGTALVIAWAVWDSARSSVRPGKGKS